MCSRPGGSTRSEPRDRSTCLARSRRGEQDEAGGAARLGTAEHDLRPGSGRRIDRGRLTAGPAAPARGRAARGAQPRPPRARGPDGARRPPGGAPPRRAAAPAARGRRLVRADHGSLHRDADQLAGSTSAASSGGSSSARSGSWCSSCRASTTTTTGESGTARWMSCRVSSPPAHSGRWRSTACSRSARPSPLGASGAILVGVVALAGSFVARAALRIGWHSFTGIANGLVIGSGAAAEIVARRVATHPEARLRIVGYLGARRRRDQPAHPSSGGLRRGDRRRSSRVRDRARRRHRPGLLRGGGGTADRGLQGHRACADLPAAPLQAARSRHRAEPARRAAGAGLPLLRPAPLDDAAEAGPRPDRLRRPADPSLAPLPRPLAADPARLRPPDPLPPDARRRAREAVHDAQVPHHGQRRREAPRRAGGPRPPRGADVQDPQRPPRDPGRPLPAPHQPRRDPPVHQRPEGRHVAGRPAARGGGRRGPLRRPPADAAECEAGADRADAGLRARRPHLRGAPRARARLPRQPLGRRRPGDPPAHAERASSAARARTRCA